MSTPSIASMKSRLVIYKRGLEKAVSAGNEPEIDKWEDSIAILEQQIEKLDS